MGLALAFAGQEVGRFSPFQIVAIQGRLPATLRCVILWEAAILAGVDLRAVRLTAIGCSRENRWASRGPQSCSGVLRLRRNCLPGQYSTTSTNDYPRTFARNYACRARARYPKGRSGYVYISWKPTTRREYSIWATTSLFWPREVRLRYFLSRTPLRKRHIRSGLGAYLTQSSQEITETVLTPATRFSPPHPRR